MRVSSIEIIKRNNEILYRVRQELIAIQKEDTIKFPDSTDLQNAIGLLGDAWASLGHIKKDSK